MEKSNQTPNSRIKSALRQLWLRSRERGEAIKRDEYTCQKCDRKQHIEDGVKVDKVEVHHKEGILNWDKVISAIREGLLVNPEHLETLCKECHKKETASAYKSDN